MDGEDHKKCENWIINFIDEYRKRYQNLPEETRKHISNLDNFNPPCQIIVIVIPNQKFTFLWLRKDPDLPDKDIQCYRPINQDEFNQIAEMILSDEGMNKMFTDNAYPQTEQISLRMFIESQLIQASRNINQLTPEFKIPEDHFVGSKSIMPMNGFFWIMYRDIINVDPETIISDIIKAAVADQKSKEEKTLEIPKSQTRKEEIVAGYSTYFYPPIWIGEKPVFDFSSKVNGKFVLPVTQTSMYKEKLVSFNQKGFFFIEAKDKQQYLRYMNEIIGTALLIGYSFDIISDADIGETGVTRDEGDMRSQTHPASITRSWQAKLQMDVITEDMINAYKQITVHDLLNILTTAEIATKDTVTSDFIVFFAHASQYIREGRYKEAFLFDWLIIERGLRIEWENYLKTHGVEGKRLKKIKHWSIDYVIEDLFLGRIIDEEIYNSITELKDVRNGLYHRGEDIQTDEEIKCHQISEYTIRNRTGIE